MAGYKHLEIPGNFERYVKDKKQSANAYYRYFLARLSKMFEYKNLPDTIPHEILDRYLMNNGIACITEVEGKLYCFYGNLGGPQDVYYRPTEFIISNPHVKSDGEIFTANIPIFNNYQPTSEIPDADLGQPRGCLLRNDSEWIGLAPLLSRYSYLMAENILTLRTADVMLRIVALITAQTDGEKLSAQEYLKSIENGILSVVGESAFFDGVKMQSPPSNNGSYLTQFIEYQQYLKGSLYNEIGLSANYNMKREAIGKGESTLDEDALLPLADNMLLCRREDLALVNEMFGTNIEVSFSSAWLKNELEALSAIANFSSGGSTPFGSSIIPSDNGTSTTTEPIGEPREDEDGSTQADDADEAKDEKEEKDNVNDETIGAAAGDDGIDDQDSDLQDSSDNVQDSSEEVQTGDTESIEENGDDNSGVSESGGSDNNDISWDDTLQTAKDNLEDKIEKGGEDNVQDISLGTESPEDNEGSDSTD